VLQITTGANVSLSRGGMRQDSDAGPERAGGRHGYGGGPDSGPRCTPAAPTRRPESFWLGVAERDLGASAAVELGFHRLHLFAVNFAPKPVVDTNVFAGPVPLLFQPC
jgi:hypothetical protein